MTAPGNIHYLEQAAIDKKKWDACIDNASNGLVYGYSFYLDHMAKHWDALVFCDGPPSENIYQAVMPLTWNTKHTFSYLYQPFLTAQGGVFGNDITAELLDLFIKNIPANFRLTEIALNQGNVFPISAGTTSLRNNYILPLDKSYSEISEHYRENIHRNIKKSQQLGCIVDKDFDVDKVIELALQQMKDHSKESEENVNRFRSLYHWLHSKKMAITYGMRLPNQELVASCVFFFSHHRAYYILVGNHPNGKTVGASHALIDAFIKDHAGEDMLLDFEGSDIQSLAFFYSSFGAVIEQYSALKINRLPWYLKWWKK